MSEKIDMTEVVKRMREAEITLTGKKFCSSCQTMQPAALGEMVGTKIRRWKCNQCMSRISRPVYKSKEKV